MQACIHRGTKEIGGSCVEVISSGKRLIIDLGLPLRSTTPDFFFEDPSDRLDGVCIYLDGMSTHIHGNPATQRRDREIREELRNRGYDVIEIPFGHLTDRGAMIKHFYRLGRILLGKEGAGKLRDEPDWFSA